MRTIGFFLTFLLFVGGESAVFAQTRAQAIELASKTDANHGTRISRDEFMSERAARFDRLDGNHDGFIDESDAPLFVRANAERMQAFRRMLAMADTNHDGRVSRAQYLAFSAHMFDMLDTDHDGYVDRSALQQAAQRMRKLADQ